LQNKAQNVNSH